MPTFSLGCAGCGRELPADRLQQRCPDCGGTLLVRYDYDGLSLADVRARPPGTWRYRDLLPLEGAPVSLGEPETPLVFASRLSERWGTEVYVKDDGGLPTGTFKARGACVGLSRAVELGAKYIVLPTAGNAGGAWALYGARAGIDVTVVMAETAPATNQAEVRAAGARLELVPGTIADAGRRAAEIAAENGGFLATTFSEPYRLEGKKAAWLEVFDQLGDSDSMRLPATIILPVGGGVAAIAAAKAAAEVKGLGWASEPAPRLVGVQPEDCRPLVDAFAAGRTDCDPWPTIPTTLAAGLRVPAPVEGALVMKTIRDSGGAMLAVSEADIVGAVADLARSEGIFCCPEGATAVAAGARLAVEGALQGPVVLYNTGAGAKYVTALAAAGLGSS